MNIDGYYRPTLWLKNARELCS